MVMINLHLIFFLVISALKLLFLTPVIYTQFKSCCFINKLQMHKEFDDARINAFVFDLTADDLSEKISPSSVDIVTMVFNQKFF